MINALLASTGSADLKNALDDQPASDMSSDAYIDPNITLSYVRKG